MGNKKRRHVDIEEVLSRPWCYYCERDFEDLKLLISHQKAKHFKCDRCGRRLNTAGGLAVHLNQVHKETLSEVENALPNRSGLDVEIFGMEGMPADVLEQHRSRIMENFYQAQEDRRIATGNPLPGQAKPPKKKLKVETPEEIKERLAEHRKRVAAAKAAGKTLSPIIKATVPASSNATQEPPLAQQTYPTDQQAQYQQQGYGYPPTGLPTRADGNFQAPPGLPQRPSDGAGGYYNGHGAPGHPGTATGDEIDQLIRMAETGARPSQAPEEAAAAGGEKKPKKGARMVYSDEHVSPEERMAQLPRYVFVPPV